MIAEEIEKLKTGPRELRRFGLMVGAVVAVLALWFFHRHKAHAPYFLGAGLVLALLGLAAPRTLKALYIGWMTVGIVLGVAVSTVLLVIFFYLVVTPIGLIARCAGKDFLERAYEPSARSYWRQRDPSKRRAPADYERQF